VNSISNNQSFDNLRALEKSKLLNFNGTIFKVHFMTLKAFFGKKRGLIFAEIAF
jgi:hypothetical protein